MDKHPKISLLGVTRKKDRNVGDVVDRDHAVAPIEHDPDGIIRLFCTGCGTYLVMTQEGAEMLAQQAGTNLPDIVSGHYFESKRCEACGSKYEDVAFV